MLAACSAGPVLERPTPTADKPAAAEIEQARENSPQGATAASPETPEMRDRRDTPPATAKAAQPPAAGASSATASTPPGATATPARSRQSDIANTANTPANTALHPKPPAQPKRARQVERAKRRAQPRRKYHGWAGIAVRRLPYADYQSLLPHLKGIASWYGPAFHGKKTANGEVYNQFELTAAHLRLPMGTRILVVNQQTQARVWVRINDRGPYKKGRILDLSRAAAARLGMIKKGTAPVRIAVVRWPDDMDPKKGLKEYGQYVIQVAAYPDALKAEGERRGLKSRFGNVRFRLDQTPQGLYSIWAGPYDDEPAARRVAAALRKGGVFSLVRAYRK